MREDYDYMKKLTEGNPEEEIKQCLIDAGIELSDTQKICQWCFEELATIGNMCKACYDAESPKEDDFDLDKLLEEAAKKERRRYL